MSELPPDLRELLEAGKRAHEPDPARLDDVYQRVLYAPHAKSDFDVAPPAVARVRLPWGSMLAAGALAVTSWWATSTPQVPPQAEPLAPPPPSASELEATPLSTPAIEATKAPVEAPRPSTALRAPAPSVAAPSVRTPSTREAVPAAHQPAPATPELSAVREARQAASDRPRASLRAREIALVPTTAPVQPELELEEELPPEGEPHETATPTSWPSWGDLEGEGEAKTYKSRPPTIVAPTREATDSLGDEVRWLVRARQFLEHGDWQSAQEALEEHQFAHPVGQLQAERRALLARTRCLAGDLASARRLYEQLREQAKGSSLLRSVERACPAVVP